MPAVTTGAFGAGMTLIVAVDLYARKARSAQYAKIERNRDGQVARR
jgi:hypothetical protein